MPATYGELRVQLIDTEKQLKGQLDDIKRAVREDGVGYSNHMADVGTEVFEQARDVAVARQLQQHFDDTRRALEKFEDGTYGICESCGAIIELARLEALPSARFCMHCQSQYEAHR
ncbi:MAG: TraR/DksA C4-type zinc finger protein [Anaerolineae bacterium]|nr:TraR/DksA C4-type zinc finger protein [Anaerolineae bacterium]